MVNADTLKIERQSIVAYCVEKALWLKKLQREVFEHFKLFILFLLALKRKTARTGKLKLL